MRINRILLLLLLLLSLPSADEDVTICLRRCLSCSASLAAGRKFAFMFAASSLISSIHLFGCLQLLFLLSV